MRVAAIYRFPVKSLRGHAVEAAEVEPWGLAGDRRWMVVDADGRFLTIRQIPAMTRVEAELLDGGGVRVSHPDHGAAVSPIPPADAPEIAVRVWNDEVPARIGSAEASSLLSDALKTPVRLVHQTDPRRRGVDQTFGRPADRVSFADGFPLLLTSADSHRDLERRLGGELSPLRFRPNLVVSGAEPWAEDTWRAIEVGAVRLRIVKPCARCVITTRDPWTGEQFDPREPLRTLATFHRARNGGIIFGQNVVPDGAGPIRVGDPVTVIDAGPSNLL